MEIPVSVFVTIITFLLGVIGALIALIYKHMFKRIEALEEITRDISDQLPRIETMVELIKDNCVMCQKD